MALAGKDVVVSVATSSGGTYNAIDEMNNMTMSHSAGNIDISEFGVDWRQRIQGLKDVTYSASGFWDPADTSGQIRIRSAWLNDTTLWVKVLPDGSTGWIQQTKVASFDVSATPDGTVEVSFELEGTGALANS